MRVLCQGGEEEGAVEPELEANKIDAEEQSSDSDYAEDQRMQLMAHMKAVRKHGGHVHGWVTRESSVTITVINIIP